MHKASGTLTDEDLVHARDALRADTHFASDFDQLLDFSGADAIALSAGAMSSISGRSAFRAGARRAFVASNPFQFGMARMFAIYAENYGHNIQVFWSAADAEAWLDRRGGTEPA